VEPVSVQLNPILRLDDPEKSGNVIHIMSHTANPRLTSSVPQTGFFVSLILGAYFPLRTLFLAGLMDCSEIHFTLPRFPQEEL